MRTLQFVRVGTSENQPGVEYIFHWQAGYDFWVFPRHAYSKAWAGQNPTVPNTPAQIQEKAK